MQARQHRHEHRDEGDQAQGRERSVIERPSNRVAGHQRRVVTGRLWRHRARRYLLQEDDRGDPDREPFDHGPRNVRQVSPGAEQRGDDHQHAGHDCHERDRVGAVLRHDRNEHHRHRARGPETWKFDPPNTAATMPATIAVINPAAAPRPVVTPNARARGTRRCRRSHRRQRRPSTTSSGRRSRPDAGTND